MSDSFRSRDLSLRVQKKLLSKMSTKGVAKNFVDENLSRILDNLYNLAKSYTGNKKEAEKLVKNVIKIVVKINILSRNDQFTNEDIKAGYKLRDKFSTIMKTVISFIEVEFSFDKAFLTRNLEDCRRLLKQIAAAHLTDKSLQRIDSVMDFFSNPAFLEDVFKKDSPHRPILQAIVDDMNKAMEKGDL